MNRFLTMFLLTAVVCVPEAQAAGDAARGEKLFAGNCSMCHPHGGNVLSPDKELKGEKFLKQFPQDSMIFSTIRKGVPNSVMSPFAKDRLSDDQVADIVVYVRTLAPAPAKQPGQNIPSKAPNCPPGATKKVPGSASREHRKPPH